MHKEVLFLLIPTFGFSDACWWGGSGGYVKKENDTFPDFNDKNLWNGWDAPPGAEKAWEVWIDKFKKSQANIGYLTDEEKAAGKLPAGHDIPDWPDDWNDLAEGFGGMEPPPWAYKPKNLGRPTHCYLPPVAGNCTENEARFGYNPFMDECQQFHYTGCGGNMNNFRTQQECQSECVNPLMGCDPDSGFPVFFP